MDDNGGQPVPGQTVTPTGSQPADGSGGQPPAQPAPQTAGPPPKPAEDQPAPTQERQAEPQVEIGAGTGTGDAASDTGDTNTADDGRSVAWTASEFIDHEKRAGWYAMLGLGAVVFAGLIYLVTRDFISVSVILVAALTFGVYAGHKPRQMEYRLDSGGLSIGQKRFRWHDFRSFSVLEEGAVPSIVFMPLKRFAVPTTIYYPPEEEDRIVGILTELLPMEQRGHDAIDRLMHRIRY